MTWESIEGWFDFQQTYDLIASKVGPSDVVVEVGCYLGKSTAYLSSKVPPDVTILAIDKWPYIAPIADRVPEREDLYGCFVSNMLQCKCSNVIPLRTTSLIASRLVRNDLAAVFLDDDHTYEAVKSGINAWLPKVRPGGIIGGHDYGAEHFGVKLAVDELLAGKFTLLGQCWVCQL
jgi:predicted O-methyltransferase YrrM